MPVLNMDESVVRAAQLDPRAVLTMLLRALVTIIFGAVGCVIFGIIGSMAWPGYGAIVGAVMGLLIFTFFGCIISRFYEHLFSAEKVHKGLHAGDFLPHAVAKNFSGGHGHFALDVTVRRAHDVSIGGMMAVVRRAPYVEVHCGSNPVKRTCVDPNMKWNETFRLKVDPHDEMIKLILFNQDMFGVTELGQVTLQIEHDVMCRLSDQHRCDCNKEPGGKAALENPTYKHTHEQHGDHEYCRPHKFRIERGASNSIVSKKPSLEIAFNEVPQHHEHSRFMGGDPELDADWTKSIYERDDATRPLTGTTHGTGTAYGTQGP